MNLLIFAAVAVAAVWLGYLTDLSLLRKPKPKPPPVITPMTDRELLMECEFYPQSRTAFYVVAFKPSPPLSVGDTIISTSQNGSIRRFLITDIDNNFKPQTHFIAYVKLLSPLSK